MKKAIFLSLLLAFATAAMAQQVFDARGLTWLSPETKWVEKTLSGLTLEQRIAQLMVVRVPLNMDDKQAKEFSDRMNGYGVGGVCFFVGTAERQVPLTRLFQKRKCLCLCVLMESGASVCA